MVVAGILILWGKRKGFWRKLRLPGISMDTSVTARSTARGASANGGVRELTAEEIAGPTAAAQARSARPARANRRTRRTPSQISTMSLPMYMKEPGEHELVIIQ